MQLPMPKPESVELYSGSESCVVPFHADTLHDLAGPVNQLSTMLALFQKRYQATPDGDDDVILDLIQSAVSRLRSLTGGLQTYARVVAAPEPPRLCDAEGLLVAALASITPPIHETDALVTHDQLPQLTCDPNQIVYTFASLIDNGIKFRGESRPEIHISAVAEEKEWVFSVRDNGIGIDPKHGSHIFHVFKRLNGDRYAGAGMGLAICKAIVARHGGRIWLGTPSERGATLLFSLAMPETN